jgi:RNA polymerase sigma-70 factor (ECF subfamily)
VTGKTDPDRTLVEKAQGELPYGTSAYEKLVKRHSGRVFQRAFGILRSGADAEEATQDVWLAVFRALGRYRFDTPFSHWLSTITLNSCRMILRRRAAEQRRRDAVGREPPPPAVPPQSRSELRKILTELLDELDPNTRVAMLMRFVEGYTYVEIASQLDLSESAVKMRVSRGSKQLRALYESRTLTKPEGAG